MKKWLWKWVSITRAKSLNLCKIALPQVGILTNIGTVHAERAGSQEMIANGKRRVGSGLPSSPEGTAILNLDDPWIAAMANLDHSRGVFLWTGSQADLWADDITSDGIKGIRFPATLPR